MDDLMVHQTRVEDCYINWLTALLSINCSNRTHIWQYYYNNTLIEHTLGDPLLSVDCPRVCRVSRRIRAYSLQSILWL